MASPNRDPLSTPAPLPKMLRFRFGRIGAKRWRKPEGVHGLELLWMIADAPPMKIGDFPHSAFSAGNPLELTFDEDQAGKRVYFAARWETGMVKKGHESDIFNAVIPQVKGWSTPMNSV
ncbi:MAG: hypothetical protein LBD58_03890 [Treponema sp.]|nr:hypothetical protein [Treponema sp.]